jgi:plasmid stabilization system protein ParE
MMMSFTVVWNRTAESRLAEIWLESSQRAGVTDAANAIDCELRRSPETVGESRSGEERIAIVPPLAIHFTVEVADRIVRVLSVHAADKEA